jgi:hypothetical protein
MKKTSKKLALDTQTVRVLNPTDLQNVVGGTTTAITCTCATVNCPTTAITCGCNYTTACPTTAITCK